MPRLARAPSSVLALSLLALAPAIAAQEERFAHWNEEFRKAGGLPAEGEIDFERDVLAARAWTVPIGTLDVCFFAAHATDDDDFRQIRRAAACLCDLVRTFAAWHAEDARALRPIDDAARKLERWIEGWRQGALHAPAAEHGGRLLAALSAPEDVVAAADALRQGVLSTIGAPEPTSTTLWLAPTRLAFVHTCSFLGSLAPENRQLLWADDVARSSEAWASRPRVMQVVALTYAGPDETGGALTDLAMDAREKTGLLQHVMNRAGSSLCVLHYGDGIDPDFEAGLAQNLVIELLGENNARTGGSGQGAFAGSRSVFVAGGNSAGGSLAALNLDSAWRGTKGHDWFVRPLKQGQKAGMLALGYGNVARGEIGKRYGHFQVADDDGRTTTVDAPFLGPAGQEHPALDGKLDSDFREMRRAYRSAFLHWLRDVGGARSKRDSQVKFAEMLRAIAERPNRVTFEAACRRTYGKRLSDVGPEPPSLEWEFLVWVGR